MRNIIAGIPVPSLATVSVILGVIGVVPIFLMLLPKKANPANAIFERDLRQLEERLHQPADILRSHQTTHTVVDDENWKDIDNTGFVLVSEYITWDLRSVQPVSATQRNRRELVSPATVRSRILIRKTGNATTYAMPYETSGAAVFTRCDGWQLECEVLERKSTIPWGGGDLTSLQLRVDVSRYEPGTEIPITVTRTYWNAFELPEQKWAGVHARHSTGNADLDIMVIEPTYAPFRMYRLSVVDRGTGAISLIGETNTAFEDPGKRYVYWRINDAVPGKSYRIDWE